MSGEILHGDVIATLRALPAESVQVCVTSPPYWGLRDYDLPPSIWGGDEACAHVFGEADVAGEGYASGERRRWQHGATRDAEPERWQTATDRGAFCAICGAWKGCLGLEPTPEHYVENIVRVFEEVRRVLRPDATVWLNIGDTYFTRSVSRQNGNRDTIRAIEGAAMPSWREYAGDGRTRYSSGHPTLKDKDLCMIPARCALALQAASWWVRSEIVWAKSACMPESAKDRPTRATESIFLLSKSRRYYYDDLAVRQPAAQAGRVRADKIGGDKGDAVHHSPGSVFTGAETANLRNFWLLSPEPQRDAHFATFPSAIPERAILAGTSEAGACRACGTPYRRLVERLKPARDWRETDTPRTYRGKNSVRSNGAPSDLAKIRAPVPRNHRDGGLTAEHGMDRAGLSHFKLNELMQANPPQTVGWEAGCACDAGDPQPCHVLDPFGGSGTTAKVAEKLGRRWTLIELNEAYVEIAEKRTAQRSLLSWEPDVTP